jgi:hypothetical protein
VVSVKKTMIPKIFKKKIKYGQISGAKLRETGK